MEKQKDNELLEIGYINNTRGLSGEVKVIHFCDNKEIFKEISSVTIDESVYEIQYVKFFKEQVILKLKDIDSVEKAQKYKNKKLFAKKDDLPPLEDGRYYIADIIGFEVVLFDGEKVGTLCDVDVSGPIDMLVVKRENKKDAYIPNIEKFVSEINSETKKIIITPIEGLL